MLTSQAATASTTSKPTWNGISKSDTASTGAAHKPTESANAAANSQGVRSCTPTRRTR